MKIKCPICKGKGEIEEPRGKDLAKLRFQAAHLLQQKGFGLREIQRLLGYKSPNSVTVMWKPRSS